MNVLGIMNGTSLDGVDYVWLKYRNNSYQLLDHHQKKFSKNLRLDLLAAASNQLSTYELAKVNFLLGKEYVKHLQSIESKQSIKTHLVGLHGQTIFHEGAAATLQIGEPSFLHHFLKCPVVSNFRSMDIATGGQGAPFAPLFLQQLSIQNKLRQTAFHNLGGISNLYFKSSKKHYAFDTGPGNLLIDQWVQFKRSLNMDKSGNFAKKGLPSAKILTQALKHPFFKKSPPKSSGRELFNLEFINKFLGKPFKVLEFHDQISTLTELTAQSISISYQQFIADSIKDILFYGGGTKNAHLMKRIRLLMPSHNIQTTDVIGWPTETIEAACFGFLAHQRTLKKRFNLTPITGGKKTLLGQVLG